MNDPPSPTIQLQSSDRKRKFSTPIFSHLRFSALQPTSSWFASSDFSTSSSYNEISSGLSFEASSSRAVFHPDHVANRFETDSAEQFESPDVGWNMLQRMEDNNFASSGDGLIPAIWDACVANPFQSWNQGETSTPSNCCSLRELPVWSEPPNKETGLPEPLGYGPGGLRLGFENHHNGPQQQEGEYHHRTGINSNSVAGSDDINHLGDEGVYRRTPLLPEAPSVQANPEGFVDPTLELANDRGGPPIMDVAEPRLQLKNHLLFWRKAQFRAQVIGHPIFGAILRSHINCVRLMTPAGKMDEVKLHLNNVKEIYKSYEAFARSNESLSSMVPPQQLNQLLNKVLMEVNRYEAALQHNPKLQADSSFTHLHRVSVLVRHLTGKNVSPPDAYDLDSGPTMSEDEEMADEEPQELDRDDGLGLSQADRSVMWTIRGHLINTLGLDTYRMRIRELRDWAMRRRRPDKLPVRSIDELRRWWDLHTDWPYPSEEEKQELMDSSGLQLNQVNNWFVNQRKRFWSPPPTMGSQGNPRHRQRNNFQI